MAALSSGTECRAFGVVANENVTLVADLLRGACLKYGHYEVQEVVLKAPLQGGTATTTLKLARKLPNANTPEPKPNPFAKKLPERWLLQHEGLPKRGQDVNELPAALREVLDSYCYCGQTPQFWMSLGARLDFQLKKKGNEYLCQHMGHEVRAILYTAHLPSQPDNLDPDQKWKSGTKYILDVTVRVPEGKHVEGARVVGAFAQRLAHLCPLQRADAPI